MRRFFLLMLANILRYRRGDIRTMLVCLLISSFFWLAQRFKRDYETNIEVPIRFELKGGIVAKGEVPRSVVARVKSSGWMLFIHNLSFQFSPLVLEVESLGSDIQKQMRNQIEELLGERLFDVQILSTNVSEVVFDFQVLSSKEVFLKLDVTKVEVLQGCRITSKSLRPESFVIHGAADELKDISDTLVIPIEAQMLEKTFTKQFNLDNLNDYGAEKKSFSTFARIEIECE